MRQGLVKAISTTAISLMLFLAFSPKTLASSVAGVVVLEATPGCDYFVVETNMGYSLLERYGGVISIWEGDRVFGEIHSYGFKNIYIEGRGEMRVWVDDFWMSASDAIQYFRSKCF